MSPDGTITSTRRGRTGVATISSTDGGLTWGLKCPWVAAINFYRSTIAVSSSGLLAVAWVQDMAGDHDIYVVTSDDQGSTWSLPVVIPTMTNDNDFPTLASTARIHSPSSTRTTSLTRSRPRRWMVARRGAHPFIFRKP